MPFPVSDIASNFALYNQVYERSTVLHDKTANTIRVADGINAYNDLQIVKSRVEVTAVTPNFVYAGPSSGAISAVPTFRALVPADLGTGGDNLKVLTHDALGGMAWVTPSSGSVAWGSITGTLSSQTDLQTALDAKQNESIVINSNTTAVLDGVYTVVASATFTDPTPAEGKGFMVFVRNGTATVGGTGYSTAGTIINRIFHSGAWANYTQGSTTLAIGTTPITGGTVGRVLFEGTGNVLQQASNIFWDNANSRLSLGIGASPAARLDILSPGTSSTDLAIRVRNNGNSINLLEQRGNGDISLRSNANSYTCNLHFYAFAGTNGWHLTNGTSFGNGAGFATLGDNVNFYSASNRIIQMGFAFGASGSSFWNILQGGTAARQKLSIGNSAINNFTFYFENTNFGIGVHTGSTTEFGTNATNTFALKTGVAPTTGITLGDGFQMYSADIVAGNASPHFRTENGDIVKIYSIGGWGTPTGTLTRTTFDTTTVTLSQLAERLAALISDLKTGQQLLKT
jgi:hypothetical protein